MPRLRSHLAQALAQALAYALAWVPVALALSLALLVTDRMPAATAIFAGTMSTLPAALLGLLIIALCGRLPWRGTSLPKLLAAHAVAALAYSLAWLSAIVLEIATFARRADLDAFLRTGAIWQAVFGILTYVAIVGITYTRSAVRQQQDQERVAARLETLRLRAELDALRARLEPHFLFNVLQTLGALISTSPARAHEALELLSRLLKRRIDSARDDDASFAEELADAREYCALERLRLGSRLTVVETVDRGTDDLIIPRFTLQPLIENAIRHGISPKPGGGEVRVTSSRNGASWTFTIEDDGVGSDPGALEGSGGMGLAVVRERFRLRYGSRATVEATTGRGAGCRVSVTLPVDADARNLPPRGDVGVP